MQISVLIENTTRNPLLTAEHGLSLYIKTREMSLLFDTGATGAFAENALKMGIDLDQVDALILSHGHYDHGGGIETFLQINSAAPVYLSSSAFGEHYNGAWKYIGLPRHLQDHPRLIPVMDRLTLAPGVTLDCCLHRKPICPTEPYGLQVMEDGCFFPEDFTHELYLIIDDGKKICFSGCAHRGVENILHWLTPEILIGGFHFKQLQPGDPRLDRAVQEFLKSPCDYYTCHCTGQIQYDYLKAKMGDRLHYLSTGDVLQL